MWKGILAAVALGIALGGGAFWLTLAFGGGSLSTLLGEQVAVVLPTPQGPPPRLPAKNPSLEPKEPIQIEPMRKEPMRKEPMRKEPVRKEPVRKEPVRKEPVRKKPAREEPVRKKLVREEPPVGNVQVRDELFPNEPVREEVAQKEPIQEAPAPVSAPAPAIPVETGTLSLNSSPWAHVTVDGVAVGRTPLTLKLPEGAHRVVLTSSVLPERTHEMQVEIQAGRTVRRKHYFKDP